jgi:hypothetical protein
MHHIIVHGKDGEQERFKLAGELLRDIISNSTLIEGLSLKSLTFDGVMTPYCLHIVSHGNESSLKLKSCYTIDQIMRSLKTNAVPEIIFIYACHAGDPNGTSKKLYDRFERTIPIVGIGRCDSISKDDDDGNALPAGGPISFMYSLSQSTPEESLSHSLARVKVPSICLDDTEGKITGRSAVTFGVLPESYTVKRVFGDLNIDSATKDYLKEVYDYLFEDYGE